MNTLLGLSAVFVVLFLYGLVRPPPSPIDLLRNEYVLMRRLPKREGIKELNVRLDELRLKNPGRSERWYLEWLVTDLKRSLR